MNPRHPTFDDLLIQSIDEGLSVMGEEPKKALYHYLSSIHLLRREDIPSKIAQFSAGIRNALGAASRVIEKLILRRLYEKIGTTYDESQGFEFADYIEDARQKFRIRAQNMMESDDASEPGSSKKAQFPG